MKIFAKSVLLAGCTLLAACGSGGGGGIVSTPAPAPSPSPSPAPSPSPSPAPSPTPSPTPSPSPTPTPTPAPAGNPYLLPIVQPPVQIPQASNGTLQDALKTPQGFVTGSLQLDANYETGYLTSTNRPYGSSFSLLLYADPDKGTNTFYNTRGGGFSFKETDQNCFEGYRGWSLNSPEGGRALF